MDNRPWSEPEGLVIVDELDLVVVLVEQVLRDLVCPVDTGDAAGACGVHQHEPQGIPYLRDVDVVRGSNPLVLV